MIVRPANSCEKFPKDLAKTPHQRHSITQLLLGNGRLAGGMIIALTQGTSVLRLMSRLSMRARLWDGRRWRPDKESPLWNVQSRVIYWWTVTEVDDERAYTIVYDGKVWQRRKRFVPATSGYR